VALIEGSGVVQVQEPQPDGTSGWVTACVCMTPADDLILRAGEPPLQHELLRTQVVDAARHSSPARRLTTHLSTSFVTLVLGQLAHLHAAGVQV
jgi:hypothetical protein